MQWKWCSDPYRPIKNNLALKRTRQEWKKDLHCKLNGVIWASVAGSISAIGWLVEAALPQSLLLPGIRLSAGLRWYYFFYWPKVEVHIKQLAKFHLWYFRECRKVGHQLKHVFIISFSMRIFRNWRIIISVSRRIVFPSFDIFLGGTEGTEHHPRPSWAPFPPYQTNSPHLPRSRGIIYCGPAGSSQDILVLRHDTTSCHRNIDYHILKILAIPSPRSCWSK